VTMRADDSRDDDRGMAAETASEQTVARVLIDLSDILIADYDVLEFLHLLTLRCVELLPGVRAAGITVGDQRGGLRVLAASSEPAHLLELFETETDEGPCVDCYLRGVPVADPDLDNDDPRWRRFAARARQDGFRAAHALPVRLRNEVIGVLNLLSALPGPLDDAAAGTARALANIATLGLLQHRAVEYRQILAEQLQHAVNSRIVIEQAKGVIAESLGLDMAAAFDELRRFALRADRRLSDVARAVAAGDFDAASPSADRQQLRVLIIRRFSFAMLGRLRDVTSAAVRRRGLLPGQVFEFVLAVHEAAANAVVHGGGGGQLLLWLADGDLYAEISDHGPGFGEGRGIVPAEPGPQAHDGRGLWLIRRVCAGLDIHTGATGTRLLLRYPLGSPSASGPAASGG
jgi:anti-sigma regulatory factor (Ser/Thr protein kinase)/GAF domain-containing protein